MASGNETLRLVDGSSSFDGGIDSGKVPTMENPQLPTGLKRNQLAWMTNCTVRSVGVLQRTGWLKAVEDFSGDNGLFQGASFFRPDNDFPYIMAQISGKIYRFNVWTDNSVADISGGNLNDPTVEQVFFCQAEDAMVIQPGDNFLTQPLFWWNQPPYTMTRCVTAPKRQIPPGKAMDYYMGRLWVQTGERQYTAGDIVYSAVPGILPQYAFAYFIENTWIAGGGSFDVPSASGSIRSIFHTATPDTALGQGDLQIGTRDAIYSLTVPVSRIDWNAVNLQLTAGTPTFPLQRVIQTRYGTLSERCVVKVNGDIFYRSYDGVRSLQMAIRYYNQWGNIPLSRNENRLLQFDDRSLVHLASGIEFDNRLLITVLPKQTPVGVAFQGIMPLDFDIITSMESRQPPAWEGLYEGLDHLQILESSFGGVQRAFSIVHSRTTDRIQIWELTTLSKMEEGDKRVTWYIESPAYVFGNMFQLKQLDSGELWFDKVFGTVDVIVDYRQDQNPCWMSWHKFQMCAARTSCEDVNNPVCYPEGDYREGYRIPVTLPHPPVGCDSMNTRPTNIGYQFQVRITVTGWCRLRSILLYALPRERQPYQGLVC